jgi:metallo-beta-lactamase class B
MKSLIFILLLSLVTLTAHSQIEPTGGNPEWSKPFEPFKIVGNVYWVGTYDLACYLITTPKGHILINTGLAASADLIKDNIKTLGFNMSDIKILTTTQGHFDHVGALAAIKEQTGAKMYADWKDAPVLADGGESDYESHNKGMTFAPVKIDRELKDKDVIELGDMKLTMLHHPGHTKGSCSFIFDVKDGDKSYKVLIANLPTIVTYRKLSEIPEYPEISSDLAYTFSSLKKQKFDIFLSSHASQFDLHKKHKPGDAYNPEVFIDRAGFDNALKDLEDAYKKKVLEK